LCSIYVYLVGIIRIFMFYDIRIIQIGELVCIDFILIVYF
jgi:hypothetical protein